MKTLEFKLNISKQKAILVRGLCDRSRFVWNLGLTLLEEAQQRRWAEKHNRPLPSGLVLKYRRGKFTGSGIRKSREGYKCCPIRQCWNIKDPQNLFSTGSYYNNSNAPHLADIPSKFKTGVHKSLQQAWGRYQDPQHPARRPRYKGKRDILRSLTNHNAGRKSKELKPTAIVGTDNGYVQFPGLGKLHVKGLYKRFDPNQEYGHAKIVCEPSGFYLQIVVETEKKPLKFSDKAIGIDPGVKACITGDNGRSVKPANLFQKQRKRLERLQRKANRQKKGSNGQKHSYQKIGKLHEKVRRSRSAFNHKLSSKLVSEYGAIAFEGSNLQNMTHAPKAKLREDGKGYEKNGAKAKAGLNRALTDVAWGDLRAKTEQKCKSAGREFEKTTAAYSSRKCHRCGEEGDRRSQSEFLCLNTSCALHQLVQSADGNAAKNHLLNSGFLATGKYRRWDWAEEMPLTNLAVAEVTTDEARELKRGKKMVISPSAGTDRKRQKRSRKGLLPEATTAPQLNGEVAPSGELSAPTNIYPKVSHGDYQEVYKTCNQQLSSKPVTQQALQLLLFPIEAIANTKTSSPTELVGALKHTPKSKSPLSKSKKKRLTPTVAETYIQQDIWGMP